MKIKRGDGISFAIMLYIIGLCLGTATNYIHENYDLIIVIIIVVFQIGSIVLNKMTRRIRLLLVNNLLFKFSVIWLVVGTILFFIHLGDSNYVVRFLVYRTMVISIFTLIVIILNMQTVNDIYKYMKAMLIGMLINYFISIYELTTGIHIGEVLGPHMINSTFVGLSNNNNYATFLLYCIPFILILFVRKKRKYKEKILFFLLLLANFYFNYRTGSIAGISGFILIFVFGFIVNQLYKKFSKESVRILAKIFAFGYLLFLVIIILLSLDSISFGSARLAFLSHVSLDFTKTFGIGLGPAGSQLLNSGWIHNLVFELLYEYGIIVFALFYLCWVKLLNKTNEQCLSKIIGGYIFAFILLLPFIWISSSSALSLHFTWVNFALLYQYFCDASISGHFVHARGKEV